MKESYNTNIFVELAVGIAMVAWLYVSLLLFGK